MGRLRMGSLTSLRKPCQSSAALHAHRLCERAASSEVLVQAAAALKETHNALSLIPPDEIDAFLPCDEEPLCVTEKDLAVQRLNYLQAALIAAARERKVPVKPNSTASEIAQSIFG